MIGLLVTVLAAISLASSDRLCPLEGDEVILYANPYNCSTFFQCYKGDLILKECPDSLHFNPEWLACDWPWAFNCVQIPPPAKWLPGNDNHTAITEPPPVCPPPGTEVNATQFVNRYNCTQYYICESGVPFLRSCPPGLNFNPTVQVCDFPWATVCNEIVGILPADADALPAKKPAKPMMTRAIPPECNGPDPPTCPQPPITGNVTQCPNVFNCSEYYICDNGRWFMASCPAGLHYNVDIGNCDHEWAAGCIPVTTTTEPPPTTTTAEPKAADPCVIGGPPNCPPPTSGGNTTFCPDTTNCTNYYICDNSGAHHLSCPPGLEFNVQYNSCDFPWSANCNVIPFIDTPELEPLVNINPVSGPNCVVGGPPNCPPPGVEINATICKDYTNCSRYYTCQNGVARVVDCPAGLEFNDVSNSCDFPWQANCVISIKTSYQDKSGHYYDAVKDFIHKVEDKAAAMEFGSGRKRTPKH